MFFLIGSGSNGKSVFVNTISSLFGQENVSTISLNQLTNEYYTLGLFGKMVNISSETPHKKQINTDMVKAAVAGDWISGRNPYKEPTKFKPYAKHFLSMNQIPSKNQNSNIKIKATVSLHSYLIIWNPKMQKLKWNSLDLAAGNYDIWTIGESWIFSIHLQ